ncbi:MAG: urease accessory protein UreE [Snowella sp.]|nr:urease accessory protein UreE [Snowella sp.]
MLIFIKRIPHAIADSSLKTLLTLSLTAEERTRSRYRFDTADGQAFFFRLPRGTVLHSGDILEAESGELIEIVAKPEPVLTVTAANPLTLLKAAYHLGNRHVPVEITLDYLRLKPDPVLAEMLIHLGVEVQEEILPFQPESGAYDSHASHHQSHHQH